jgi:RHS repeat-associated protein
VRLVVNTATGAIAQRIDYDEWGNATYVSGAPDFQPFGFAGGLTDRDTGIVRFGARDYDPRVGRWTSKDPIGFTDGSNLVVYAGGDPISYIDPNGQYLVPVLAAVAVMGTTYFVLDRFWEGASSCEEACRREIPKVCPFPPGEERESFVDQRMPACVQRCLRAGTEAVAGFGSSEISDGIQLLMDAAGAGQSNE